MASFDEDGMSSPDPLTDAATSDIFMPSSQRVTRSQRSTRFASLGRSPSPRKQTFSLEVGDNSSPQKLLVTVETEDEPGPRRRLFKPSLSPVKQYATTTTVPLRKSIEDESTTAPRAPDTPRRRGRPRKSNGTPMPKAGTKRRAGTPMKRTPRRARTAETDDDGQSEASVPPTPTSSKRRGRPRKSASRQPSIDLGAERARVPSSTVTARAGRRRRQALVPDEFLDFVDAAAETASIQGSVGLSENDMDLVRSPSVSTRGGQTPRAKPAEAEADAEDLWMATLSDQATPRARRANTRSKSRSVSKTPRSQTRTRSRPLDLDAEPELVQDNPVQLNQDTEGALEHEVEEGRFDDGVDHDYVDLAAQSDASSADLVEADPTRGDTIAQGEDFSMIFADSIPSLQANLSGIAEAGPEEDMGDETHQIINSTLESLRRSQNQKAVIEEEEDVAGDETPRREEKAIRSPDHPPSRRESPIQARTAWSPARSQATRLSLSPRKLQSSPLRQQILRLNAKKADDAPDGTPSSEATPRAGSRRGSARIDVVDEYEDSFSAIPDEILDAATPERPDFTLPIEFMWEQEQGLPEEEREIPEQHTVEHQPEAGDAEDADEDEIDQTEEQIKGQPETNEEAEIDTANAEIEEVAQDGEEYEADEEEDEDEPQDLQNFDANIGSEPQAEVEEGRLDEADVSVQQTHAIPSSVVSAAEQSEAGRLPTPDDTPPYVEDETVEVIEKSAHASQASHMLNVSHISHASQSSAIPSSPPEAAVDLGQSEAPVAPRLGMEVTPLNQLSSPAQEPQSLLPEPVFEKLARPALSPIVRIGRMLQTVTSDPPSPEANERQLGSPFRSSASKESWHGSRESQTGRRLSMSPARPARFSRAPSTPLNRTREDPFGATRNTGQPGFMQALDRSIGAAGPARNSLKGSVASAKQLEPADEMSWVATDAPVVTQPIAVNAAQMPSDPVAQSPPQATEEPAEPLNPEPSEPEVEQEDDETDIWEFEAQREPPRSARQTPFGKPTPGGNLRRKNLPSPWTRKTTKQTPKAPIPVSSMAAPRPPVEEEDTSEASGVDEEPANPSLGAQAGPSAPVNPQVESAAKSDRFNLSSFFSSPAAIPGMLTDKLLGRTKTPEPAAPKPASMATHSLFPQVPAQTLQPRESKRRVLFSPVRSVAPAREPTDPSSPSPEPEEQVTPRQSRSFSQPAAHQTPPRMQLSHADITRWQHETSDASDEVDHPRPLLRPLPPKTASPTKSSLRSPMKPHTPGRVVDFTSSVLSPMEQARARQARNTPQPAIPAPLPRRVVTVMDDKENHDVSDISMSDALPLPAKAPSHIEPLSQTIWTRAHWLLLDELLQYRRGGPFEGYYPPRSERLLGRTVKSQGEAMRLEKWHLECVDAFKSEVGGWEEAELAKRLFALILGEERRGTGEYQGSGARMFH